MGGKVALLVGVTGVGLEIVGLEVPRFPTLKDTTIIKITAIVIDTPITIFFTT